MTVLCLDSRCWDIVPLDIVRVLVTHRGTRFFATSDIPRRVAELCVDAGLSECSCEPEAALVVTSVMDVPCVRRRVASGETVISGELSHIGAVCEAVDVMRRANERGEWEREQTHRSLLGYLYSEAKELADAVNTWEKEISPRTEQELKNELSDILLQVLFHAEIASRRGAFCFADVAAAFVHKMRMRSPYLFDGSTGSVSSECADALWRKGKEREREDG